MFADRCAPGLTTRPDLQRSSCWQSQGVRRFSEHLSRSWNLKSNWRLENQCVNNKSAGQWNLPHIKLGSRWSLGFLDVLYLPSYFYSFSLMCQPGAQLQLVLAEVFISITAAAPASAIFFSTYETLVGKGTWPRERRKRQRKSLEKPKLRSEAIWVDPQILYPISFAGWWSLSQLNDIKLAFWEKIHHFQTQIFLLANVYGTSQANWGTTVLGHEIVVLINHCWEFCERSYIGEDQTVAGKVRNAVQGQQKRRWCLLRLDCKQQPGLVSAIHAARSYQNIHLKETTHRPHLYI